MRKRHANFTRTPSNRHRRQVCWRGFTQSNNKPMMHNMKNFFCIRSTALALAAGLTIATAGADITFLGVAAGDASTNDVIVWTRAKDESNPLPTDINVQ